jgi:tetratricopeptide (TPR) repeat protein
MKIKFITIIYIFSILNGLFQIQQLYSQENRKILLHPSQQNNPTIQQQRMSQEQRLFRTAQSYLSMKRYAQAQKILEQLHEKKPENISYYRSLFQVYVIVGYIDRADSLVKFMLEILPQNPQFSIDEANLLFRKKNKDAAIKQWEKIVKQHSNNFSVYSQVANAMLENQLFEDAIVVYEKAIRTIPKTDHLYQTIASIYQNRLMYKDAATSLLVYLEKQPQQKQYIFSRILSFKIEAEDRLEFFNMLQEKIKNSPNPDDIRLLLAQLYQRYDNFEEAFRIYTQLEGKQKDPQYLIQFAKSAAADSSYEIALKAYDLILDKFTNNKNLMETYMGAVASLLKLAERDNDISYADKAMLLIEKAQLNLPKHKDLPGLIFLKGVFRLEYYFDVDGAISIFFELTNLQNAGSRYRDLALVKLGECYLIKGNLDDAQRMFVQVKEKSQTKLAQMQLARSYYFKKEWENATDILNKIIQISGASNEITNDALQLNMRIALSKTIPEVLALLSESDLLVYQHKKSEAIEKLMDVLNLPNIPASVKSDVYRQITNLSLELSEIPQALDFCIKAIDDSSIYIYADLHLFLMATILEQKVQRYKEAYKSYQELLRNFPHSLLVEKARSRVTYLRNEKIIELP